eukprot:11673407-Alexandrium_andersonii.AAC.1
MRSCSNLNCCWRIWGWVEVQMPEPRARHRSDCTGCTSVPFPRECHPEGPGGRRGSWSCGTSSRRR